MNQIFMVEAYTGNICLSVQSDVFNFENTSFKKISDDVFVLEKSNKKNVIYLNEIFHIDEKIFFFCRSGFLSLLDYHSSYILEKSVKKIFKKPNEILFFLLDFMRSKFVVFYAILGLLFFIFLQHISSVHRLDFDLVKSHDILIKKNIYSFFNQYNKNFIDIKSPDLDGQNDQSWQIIYSSLKDDSKLNRIDKMDKKILNNSIKNQKRVPKIDADVQIFLKLGKEKYSYDQK